MKRFYKLVSTSKRADGHHILLDGKPVKTKSGVFLSAPNEAIAHVLVEEWAAQREEVIPDSMPLTQIINTQIDRVAVEREAMMRAILKYLDTDLICYVAQEPKELVEQQNAAWSSWRDWFKDKFGVQLETTTGLAALKQSAEAHEQVIFHVQDLDDARFTVLQLVTAGSGSLVLALAFVDRQAKTQDILSAAFVEEDYKDQIYAAEKYGADPSIEKQKKSMQSDLDACETYLKFL